MTEIRTRRHPELETGKRPVPFASGFEFRISARYYARVDRPFRYEDIPEDPKDLERDCDLSFFRASGPGGQHRNKTETAVRVVHRPTGTIAAATEERSQSRNREVAIERLREKLVRKLKPRRPRKRTRVPAAAKRARLDEKLRLAQKKRLRKVDEER